MNILSYQKAKEYLAKFNFKNRNDYYLFRKTPNLFDSNLIDFPDFLHINPKGYYIKSEGIDFSWPDYLSTNTKSKNTKNLTIDIVKELFKEYKINSIDDYKKICNELVIYKDIDLPVNLNDHFRNKGINFSYEDHYYKNDYSISYSEFEIVNVINNLKKNYDINCLKDYNDYCKSDKFLDHQGRLPFDLHRAYPNIFYSKIIKIIIPHILSEFNESDSIEKYLPTHNEKVSWKCRLCNHIWNVKFNYRLRLGKGCPKCGAIQCISSRKQNVAKNGQGFLNEFPHLKNEIDTNSSHNASLNFDEITSGSDIYIDWICSIKTCKIKWKTQVKNRCLGTGCPDCSIPKRTKQLKNNNVERKGSFLQTKPYEAKYWDYDKNIDTPNDVVAGSDEKRHFICFECKYSWYAQINTVAKGQSRCKCFSRIFEQQTRLYAEFSTLGLITEFEYKFPNTEISGTECDIYLPQIKVCIECDGYTWHNKKDKINYDIAKDKKFNSLDLLPIRFRDSKLQSISKYEIYYDQGKDLLAPIMQLIDLIISIIEDGEIKNKLIQYKNNNKFIGDDEFYKIYNERKIPNSLANKRPDLYKEYSPDNPIKAESVCLGHKYPVKWVCQTCSHIYERLICNRNRPTDKGCPKCSNTGNYIGETNNLYHLFPKIVDKFWDYEKNKKPPTQYRPNSTKEIWINCDYGCSIQVQVNALTRKECKNFKCPNCKKRNLKLEEN